MASTVLWLVAKTMVVVLVGDVPVGDEVDELVSAVPPAHATAMTNPATRRVTFLPLSSGMLAGGPLSEDQETCEDHRRPGA
jgi:hypothetical protein